MEFLAFSFSCFLSSFTNHSPLLYSHGLILLHFNLALQQHKLKRGGDEEDGLTGVGWLCGVTE